MRKKSAGVEVRKQKSKGEKCKRWREKRIRGGKNESKIDINYY